MAGKRKRASPEVQQQVNAHQRQANALSDNGAEKTLEQLKQSASAAASGATVVEVDGTPDAPMEGDEGGGQQS